MKKTLTILLAVLLVLTLSAPVWAASASSVENEIALSNKEAAKDNANAKVENAADNPSKSERQAFKSQFSALFTQLNGLRATCSTNWTTIKNMNAQIKSKLTAYKTSLNNLPSADKKAKMKALSAALAPLRAQVKAVDYKINTIRTSKNAEWTKYRLAVKAKNAVDAEAALKNILTYKQQIIDQQAELIKAKQAILDAIKM